MDFFVCECVCRVGEGGGKKSRFFSWHDFRKTTPPVLLNRPFPPRAHTSENDLLLKPDAHKFHIAARPRALLCWDSGVAWLHPALPAFPGPKPKHFRLYFLPIPYLQGTQNPKVLADPRFSLHPFA